ncbi:hypothetical protein GTH10_08025 [Burkholderia thailandensis]|uniref:hypothetical protein n=1 Tax=Burkholderia thailandensis TaxID=57975 RepID=UPI00148E9F60|nr:hypothetical protein [Burkholderia thailandensis]NOK47318.1 hypothetical protein [Burkholderia thailandensis]
MSAARERVVLIAGAGIGATPAARLATLDIAPMPQARGADEAARHARVAWSADVRGTTARRARAG